MLIQRHFFSLSALFGAMFSASYPVPREIAALRSQRHDGVIARSAARKQSRGRLSRSRGASVAPSLPFNGFVLLSKPSLRWMRDQVSKPA